MLTAYDRELMQRWDTGAYVGVESAEFIAAIGAMSLSGLMKLRERVTDEHADAVAEMRRATKKLMDAIAREIISDPRAPFILDGATKQEAPWPTT